MLDAPPVAEHVAKERMLGAEGEQHAQSLRAAKAPLIAGLQTRGVTVRSQAEHLINAIMIDATEDDLAWVRRQPGVRSAEFARAVLLHLDAATSIVGAPQAWNQVGGQDNAGQGVRIAMIDSGIDINHPMFAATGTAPTGFPKADNAANMAYTNNKVIVARNYVCPPTGTCPGATSFDMNASDGAGHGTGTASAAAGKCVSTPVGSTICGVAPGAYLGNYKVFDSNGGGFTTDVIQAMNDSVADGFTVINFSGGSVFTGVTITDSAAYKTIHNAVAAGVVVVVSAGNCGPVTTSCRKRGDNSMADPGILTDALTVGASTNSHIFSNTVTITSSAPVPPNLQTLAAFAASTPTFKQVGPGAILDVATLDGTGFGCNTLPANSLTGKIALLRWNNYCFDDAQTNNAAAAGAAASIIMDNFPEEVYGGFNGLLFGGSIASTFIGYQDGKNLLAFLAANPGAVNATVKSAFQIAPQTADQVSDYSGRGPTNDFFIKPDLLAPGEVYVASQKVNPDPDAIYDPSGFLFAEGTSYSAPIASGAVAIVRQVRPALTPQDVKSVLVNTATAVTSDQDAATVSAMHTGGGRLYIPAALASTLTSDPPSVTFGQTVTPTSSTANTQSVTLKNIGTAAETFNVSVKPMVANSVLQVSTDRTSVTLAPGATAVLNLKMALTTALYGIYEGTVVLQSTSTSTTIHIPYWMMLGSPNPSTGGLVDGAAFGKNVSPGGIVSLFGTALGTAGATAGYIPLPYDLNHVVVTIQGRYTGSNTTPEYAVPLFYTSSGQINFQIRYDLVAARTDTLRVYLAGIVGNSLTFQAAPSAPGIFASNGTAIVVHSANQALVTAANPAAVGEVVTIYCAGLGPVVPSVFEGDPAPIPPAITTLTPTVAIGGINATVQFSGLAPLFAGLYQINATIAAGTPSGSQQITVTIGGATSNSLATFVR